MHVAYLSYFHSPYYLDIQKLFTQKQQLLSQFNENTMVKGVRMSRYCYSFACSLYLAHQTKFQYESAKCSI